MVFMASSLRYAIKSGAAKYATFCFLTPGMLKLFRRSWFNTFIQKAEILKCQMQCHFIKLDCSWAA